MVDHMTFDERAILTRHLEQARSTHDVIIIPAASDTVLECAPAVLPPIKSGVEQLLALGKPVQLREMKKHISHRVGFLSYPYATYWEPFLRDVMAPLLAEHGDDWGDILYLPSPDPPVLIPLELIPPTMVTNAYNAWDRDKYKLSAYQNNIQGSFAGYIGKLLGHRAGTVTVHMLPFFPVWIPAENVVEELDDAARERFCYNGRLAFGIMMRRPVVP